MHARRVAAVPYTARAFGPSRPRHVRIPCSVILDEVHATVSRHLLRSCVLCYSHPAARLCGSGSLSPLYGGCGPCFFHALIRAGPNGVWPILCHASSARSMRSTSRTSSARTSRSSFRPPGAGPKCTSFRGVDGSRGLPALPEAPEAQRMPCPQQGEGPVLAVRVSSWSSQMGILATPEEKQRGR